MARPPLSVWIVVLQSTAVAIALIWIDHLYRHPAFIPIYFLLCAALIYGIYSGARWAFVINVITVWIFPLETFKGIKQPLTGTTLSILHVIAFGLLLYSWQYYWKKRPADAAVVQET